MNVGKVKEVKEVVKQLGIYRRIAGQYHIFSRSHKMHTEFNILDPRQGCRPRQETMSLLSQLSLVGAECIRFGGAANVS